ncbi:DUF2190 family protein [Corynebacterium sp. 153RC1]|uniref:capsid cement protein n=1 Tax=unclassified Corynebacterium TaxID=2624378 RepID=UPI00211C040F|nr:DUF2190 family protein [Corynebacterium sp. 209RC1]MCQ9355751.1 DUF2190 family protein [Corynebacterium sp. 1222RC1]MCQ9357916.1 DUF2190 family protein [Corynebacterium sp. 122RC1]MCQ9360112.1 DUF2190 family protein [Corynebacterium sp. 142RC1]MCQ9362255.1 DUF2190 family protein [Corynebacterium sp. 153RC1]MCQ9364391.1 DUF2190 family protein [Corynebacterium sp. 732RC1]MCQ9366584.1 DUF2190 family protein [Corynebacterium sp. 70RC1]
MKAAEAISAGSFVEISGKTDGLNPVVKPAPAGSAPFGIVAHNVAKDAHVMVYRAGHIVDDVASGSIAAGDLVKEVVSGKVLTRIAQS